MIECVGVFLGIIHSSWMARRATSELTVGTEPNRTETMDVEEEVRALVREIRERLGTVDAETGKCRVKFGTLFRDEGIANAFEALNGTLRAAKKRKLLDFAGEMLLQGAHDDVDIVLL